MDRKLTEFVSLLRRNGLPVSPPEVQDAATAITLVGYADRGLFHDALASTLAKSTAHSAIFDRCFDSFFRFSSASAENAAAENADSPRNSPEFFGQGQGGGSGGQGSGGGQGQPVPGITPSELGEQLLANAESELATALAQAVETANLAAIRVTTQRGLFGRRILMAMGLAELERELSELDASSLPAAAQRATGLREARDRLRGRVRETVDRYFQLSRENNRDAVMREVDFALLREFRDVEAVIRRMARKLITLHRRREKLAARGLLDVRATLRHNLSHDGVLINPYWRRVRKDKPRVIAVCDVSRSVSQHARFLLLFLYSLQEVIPRLRSFAFSSSLHEVTALFEKMETADAIEAVMDRYGMGSTDYGRAFVDLERLALSDIDKRTTLIILGDARNNNGEARLDLLREFHLRAKQVIWLNPEAMNRWGSGDSEMLRYQSACTRSHTCRNLAELERIVDRLLKTA
ncbi:MAG: VWA domain-containing protein [Pedobacter sp.]|nr:VWA domain-containing protein [Pedobacter sp.]